MNPLELLKAQLAALELQVAAIRGTLDMMDITEREDEGAPDLPEVEEDKGPAVFGG